MRVDSAGRSPEQPVPMEAGEGESGQELRNRVRELREHQLMTQAELASRARVALRTIHSVEKGLNCRPDTKRKILTALSFAFEDRDHVFPPGAKVTIRRSPHRGSTASGSPRATEPQRCFGADQRQPSAIGSGALDLGRAHV
jgi:DNA-binding XRE family transcriptional regulator